jgi:uncharacterized protein (TIGR00288 family)
MANSSTTKTVAIFIDADNATCSKITDVIKALEKHGTLSIRRAYGNWKSTTLDPWCNVLHEHAIQPVQQFDLIKGKNATDIAMTIDVMDTLLNKNVDTYCLMTSDCDFTPLAMRLRSDGKAVIGIGERHAPEPFKSACTLFIYTDELSDKNNELHQDNQKPETSTERLLKTAIQDSLDSSGWAFISPIGQWMKTHTNFDIKKSGHSNLTALLMTIPSIQIKVNSNGYSMVRLNR